MTLEPLQHQIETIDSLNEQFRNNNNKSLVVLPTGSGKTHTVAFHIRDLKPKTFLYIVHRSVILEQTVRIFREICQLNNAQIGIVDEKHKEFHKPYIFATIQTLCNDKNLEKMRKDVEYMVVDEYHHVAMDSYQKVLMEHLNPKYLVGLTATPYRLDKKDIMKFVDGNVANKIDLFEGIQRDILVPFNYIGLWDNIDYTEIRWSGHKYNVGDLDKKLIIHKRDEAVLKEYIHRVQSENRKAIAFCNSIDHVKRITKKFKKAGIKAAGITYKESHEQRAEILHQFRNGGYDILFTRDILNEGVDFPECSALLFLRPTISKTIFFQQLGRGLRKMKGKKDVLVLDYIGNYHKAFEKKNWLQFQALAKDNPTGAYTKPFYEYSPDIHIYFAPQVIELMDLQERSQKDHSILTDERVLQDYLNCCKQAGKDFLRKHEYIASPHRKFHIKRLVHKYGSFRDFLEHHNLMPQGYGEQKSPANFYNCDDKRKLIDNYYQVKKKWLASGGKNHMTLMRECPPLAVINDHKISKYGAINYKNNWNGKYSNFLKEIGELDNKNGFLRTDPIEKREKHIAKIVKDLQKKLGRKFITYTEFREEYGGYVEDYITRFAKGWTPFKKKFGIPDTIILKCKICNKNFKSKSSRIKSCSEKCRKELRKCYNK